MSDLFKRTFGQPRNPKRIPAMLARLQYAWEQCPDLRLGQLVTNLLERHADGDAADMFQLEDDEAYERLGQFIFNGEF